MPVKQALMTRAENQCELCKNTQNLSVYEVPPTDSADSDKCILVCDICAPQLAGEVDLDQNHWRCLNDSMWSSVAAVQITAWRMLNRLTPEGWAQDLLDMLYLDDEMIAWAKSGMLMHNDAPTYDSNGAELKAGDNVTLIKDLDVKGANFTAKRGTPVRNISLTRNPEHIEGRVNGTRIVLVSKFLKKM
ncbi:PhnA domain-containing protein [Aliikangiella sp. IMCC44653]